MRTCTSRTRIILLALLAPLLALPAVSVVVCVGPGGHFAIEEACMPGRCEADASDAPGETLGAQAPQCLDIALALGDAAHIAVSLHSKKHTGGAGETSPAEPVYCDLLAARPSGRTLSPPCPAISFLPAHIRTTVLLI